MEEEGEEGFEDRNCVKNTRLYGEGRIRPTYVLEGGEERGELGRCYTW